MLVAVLDGCRVQRCWGLLSSLQDAQGLGGKSGVWCKHNPWCRKLSSPQVLNLLSRLHIHEVPASLARWTLGRFVFIHQQNKLNQEITGSRVYISHLPAYTSILCSSHTKDTTSILNYPNIMWLAQNIASCSETHPIISTTLYVPSGLPSTTCNCIITLMPRMLVHFQLTVMAPKGRCKGKGKATARGKMPTSVIKWSLLLDWSSIKGFMLNHIFGLTRIYNVCSVEDEREWYHFYDTIYLHPVTTRDISQFLPMWPHRRSRCLSCKEWWAAFRSSVGQMNNKTHDQTNDWMWDNPHTFRD